MTGAPVPRHLSAAERTRLREVLVERLDRIRRSLEAADAEAASLLVDRCREGSGAPLEGVEGQRVLSGLRDRDARRLGEVLAALDRLERLDRHADAAAPAEAVRPPAPSTSAAPPAGAPPDGAAHHAPYGTCVRCAGPIAFERLEIAPEAVHCARCAP